MITLTNQPRKGDVYFSVRLSKDGKNFGYYNFNSRCLGNVDHEKKFCKKKPTFVDAWLIDNTADVRENWTRLGITFEIKSKTY